METVDMRVLVTGSKGQLGSDIVNELKKNHMEHFAADRSNFDLMNDSQMVEILEKYQPTHVIHCAAYTHVDQAEEEKDLAYKVNVEATQLLAKWCQANGAKLVFFSTDYVFDGNLNRPYTVLDKPNPVNYYGFTKAEAEQKIQDLCDDYLIYRVSWLFGLNGQNFVKTISNLLKFKESITVVDDQIGSPTFTVDIATYVVQKMKTDIGFQHLHNKGFISWYEFAKLIQKYLKTKCYIVPIHTSDNEKKKMAKRPLNSRLEAEEITQLRPIEDALFDFLTLLMKA